MVAQEPIIAGDLRRPYTHGRQSSPIMPNIISVWVVSSDHSWPAVTIPGQEVHVQQDARTDTVCWRSRNEIMGRDIGKSLLRLSGMFRRAAPAGGWLQAINWDLEWIRGQAKESNKINQKGSESCLKKGAHLGTFGGLVCWIGNLKRLKKCKNIF